MNENQELFIDESMIKNINDYNLIKDEIICEICQGILIKPKQCEICESIFCEKCIKAKMYHTDFSRTGRGLTERNVCLS